MPVEERREIDSRDWLMKKQKLMIITPGEQKQLEELKESINKRNQERAEERRQRKGASQDMPEASALLHHQMNHLQNDIRR